MKIADEIFILNSEYCLRPDTNRILFYYRRTEPPIECNVTNFVEFQHPIFAVLLTLFDGKRTFSNVLDQFVYVTGMARESAEGLAAKLVNNTSEFSLRLGEHNFFFPKNTLLPITSNHTSNQATQAVRYNPFDFLIPNQNLDFDSQRLHLPLDTTLILNNICATRCIYCYTDKNKPQRCSVKPERLKELIREAAHLGMRSFHLTGGEIFMHSNWPELLRELTKNGFDPFISTKYPLTEDQVKLLKDIGVNRIMFSLDSLDKSCLTRLLRVNPRYRELALRTLDSLNRHGFHIRVNSQITALNQDNMEDLFQHLLQYENVKQIRARGTGYSRFGDKDNPYDKIRPDKEKLTYIKTRMQQLQAEHDGVKFLYFSAPSGDTLLNCSAAEKQTAFKKRSRCSGNFLAFIILSDGKVTICEELYHHPKFIIGDVNHQSLEEVWNSPRALELFNLEPTQVDAASACKRCSDFKGCHQGKGVCWKLALYAYGDDKWDYPDPRCHRAPEPENTFYIP